MTLVWTPVFALLIAEVILCILLLLPFDFSRRIILNLFDRIFANELVRTILKVVLLILILSLAMVLMHLRSQLEHKKHHEGDFPVEEQFLIFYEERNAFLLGFTVFLMPLISQFLSLFVSIRNAQQAEATATASQPSSSNDQLAAITELADLEDQIRRLRTELRTNQTLKSQVEGRQREIERLHAENDQLQQRLTSTDKEDKKDQ